MSLKRHLSRFSVATLSLNIASLADNQRVIRYLSQALRGGVFMLILASGISPAAAQVSQYIGTGNNPTHVAVNPLTNKIYVANQSDNTITVIDGATSATTTVSAGQGVSAIAVNTRTNTIYAANEFDNTVTVVDGATNTVTSTLPTTSAPLDIVVNAVTNTVYVSINSGLVYVIDGATNTVTTTVTVGLAPQSMAVNPVTNKIYVANFFGNSVSVIDGATNAVTTFGTASGPVSIAVNLATNRIYVANQGANNMTVIDGLSNSIVATVPAGNQPNFVTVNPVTNKVYVVDQGSLGQDPGEITIIDGVTNQTVTVTFPPGGHLPQAAAVNPVTNKIYVPYATVTFLNTPVSAVLVIDGDSNATSVLPAFGFSVAVAVNPVTNKIYSTDYYNSGVTVIDGATNVTATVATGQGPSALAVNPVTGNVYVANSTDNTATVITGSTNSTASVPTDSGPTAVAVNPVTNKTYIANGGANSVTVIDGNTNAHTTVTVGNGPAAIDVNPVTNKIYVANAGDDSVTVIDGVTNNTVTLTGVPSPGAVAVNPVTNKIYVAGVVDQLVTVIDGASNATATVPAGFIIAGLAVNTATNKIYSSNVGDNTVTVIDGATSNTATVNVGINPIGLAVNPVNNKIYVADAVSNDVTIIDGATNTTTTATVGSEPRAMVWNPASNKVYVTNNFGGVTVFDGGTGAVLETIAVGNRSFAIAVNPVTSRIYVANQNSNNVTVIDEAPDVFVPPIVATDLLPGNVSGSLTPIFDSLAAIWTPVLSQSNVYYQLDSTQGPWLPGAPNGAPISTGPDDISYQPFTETSPALAPGNHVVYTFAADSRLATTQTGHAATGPVTAMAFTVIPAASSTVTLSADANPAPAGQAITLTATVSGSGTNTPTGMVTFNDGSNALAPPVSLSGGVAVLAVPLTAGSHSITAVYSGDISFTGATSSVLSEVVQSSTAASLIANPNPVTALSTETFTATVAVVNGSGTATPSGSVSLWEGNAILITKPLDANLQAVFQIEFLISGTHSMTAQYNGDANFAGSSATVQVFVKDLTETALAPLSPAAFGSPVTFTASVGNDSNNPPLTGMVTFRDGATLLGGGTLNGGVATFTTSALSVGTHSIIASYDGNSTAGGSTSDPVTQVITKASTAAVVSSSASPVSLGNIVTLTALVSSPGGLPSGSVTFMDGSNALGTGTLNSNGVASFSTSGLSVGSHSITVSYGGDTNFTSSTSAALSQIVNPVSIVVTAAPSSQTVAAGNAATFHLTVSASGTLSGPISFSCIGLPQGASCSFSPASITAGTSGTPVTLTVSTTARTSATLAAPPSSQRSNGLLATRLLGGLNLGVPAIVLLAGRRKRKSAVTVRVAMFALLLLLTICLAGCGGTPTPPTNSGGTPAGTYSLGISSASGATQTLTPATLVVQ